MLYSTVVVGWFFTSMSLLQGKGTSGVAGYPEHGAHLLAPELVLCVLFSDSRPQKYAPTLMRGWCVLCHSLWYSTRPTTILQGWSLPLHRSSISRSCLSNSASRSSAASVSFGVRQRCPRKLDHPDPLHFCDQIPTRASSTQNLARISPNP